MSDDGEHFSDDRKLRTKAREAIMTGALPDRRPDGTWGGPGAGQPCTICGETLRQEDVELEIEFIVSHENPDVRRYHVHGRCFAVWEAERRSRKRTRNFVSMQGIEQSNDSALGGKSAE